MTKKRENSNTREKNVVLAPLHLPQIPNGLAWNWNWGSTEKGWWLPPWKIHHVSKHLSLTTGPHHSLHTLSVTPCIKSPVSNNRTTSQTPHSIRYTTYQITCLEQQYHITVSTLYPLHHVSNHLFLTTVPHHSLQTLSVTPRIKSPVSNNSTTSQSPDSIPYTTYQITCL
jgi:hypothetical protein